MAQRTQVPNVDSQRAAMKKLNFLVGNWLGEAHMQRGSGEIELVQKETAQYRLDGLILTIEVWHNRADGQMVLQALGIISYDDGSRSYHMRAFNDGRWLETELKLADNTNEIRWGFHLGEIKTNSVLRINDKGEWTELHEITIGSQPPRKLMDVKVRRQQ